MEPCRLVEHPHAQSDWLEDLEKRVRILNECAEGKKGDVAHCGDHPHSAVHTPQSQFEGVCFWNMKFIYKVVFYLDFQLCTRSPISVNFIECDSWIIFRLY